MIEAIWGKRAGRAIYAAGFLFLAGLVWLLPWIVKSITVGMLGRDAMMSAPRMVFGMYGLMIGVIVLAVPLILLTRYRLRDAGLSGVYLFLTPLPALGVFTVAPASGLATLGLNSINPLATPAVIMSVAFSLALAVIPTRPQTSGSANIWRLVDAWTACDGGMGRGQFQRRAAPAIAALVVLHALPNALIEIGANTASVASVLDVIRPLAEAILLAILASAAVRRLHDLGHTCALATFFPLGFAKAIFMAINPMLLVATWQIASAYTTLGGIAMLLLTPTMFLAPLWAAASLPVLVYLLFASGRDRQPISIPALAASTLAAAAVFGLPAGSTFLWRMLSGQEILIMPDATMVPSIAPRQRVWYRPYRSGEQVQRGDIVVYDSPTGKLVSRIIGLPSDKVELVAGKVFLNGVELKRDAVPSDRSAASSLGIERFSETLPSGVSYRAQQIGRKPVGTLEFSVPADSYLRVGDNRNEGPTSTSTYRGYIVRAAVLGRVNGY